MYSKEKQVKLDEGTFKCLNCRCEIDDIVYYKNLYVCDKCKDEVDPVMHEQIVDAMHWD